MCSYLRVSIKPGWSGEWSFGSWSCWRRSICQVPFQVCAIGPRFHCCFDLFVARHLHLQVCDLARLMAMRNLSPFRQTTQALGLLEHLAQDQAASVALRLRDPYLGWLWRCPCSPVGFRWAIRCWSVRACAVRTLHLIGPPAVPVLTSRLKDSDGSWRLLYFFPYGAGIRVSRLQPVYSIVFYSHFIAFQCI